MSRVNRGCCLLLSLYKLYYIHFLLTFPLANLYTTYILHSTHTMHIIFSGRYTCVHIICIKHNTHPSNSIWIFILTLDQFSFHFPEILSHETLCNFYFLPSVLQVVRYEISKDIQRQNHYEIWEEY